MVDYTDDPLEGHQIWSSLKVEAKDSGLSQRNKVN
jgi:hypothetical protein